MTSGLNDILDDLKDAEEEDSGTTSVGDILDAFAERSLGALLTVLGAIALIPVIGGIPGMSILTGTLVAIAVIQSLFSEGGGLWAPDRVRGIEVDDEKFDRSVEKVRPAARFVDRLLKPRLGFLVGRWPVALCALLLAGLFYPMAVVPWGVTVPAAAVMLLGLALLGRDGVFAALGYAFTALSLWLIWRYAL